MKLSLLVERIVDNMVEASATAEKARELGLTYAGRGWWKDQSGKTVARTVDGNLVRVEDEPEDGTAPTEAPPEATAASPSATEPEGDTDDLTPDAEPQEPTTSMSGILSRMLAANDEDVVSVQKQLAKKFRASQTPEERAKYQRLLDQAAEYEKKKKADLQASLDAVAKKRADALAARKAKYVSKYPSPQI